MNHFPYNIISRIFQFKIISLFKKNVFWKDIADLPALFGIGELLI